MYLKSNGGERKEGGRVEESLRDSGNNYRGKRNILGAQERGRVKVTDLPRGKGMGREKARIPPGWRAPHDSLLRSHCIIIVVHLVVYNLLSLRLVTDTVFPFYIPST